MPVVFDYICDDCGTEIRNHLKMSRDEPDPECPGCAALARKLPPLVAIGTNKGRAVDIAQAEVESMGFTNMKDNLREGDVAAPALSPGMQKAVDGFWTGGNAILGGNPRAIAKNAAAQASAEGSNPLTLLQKRKKMVLEASK